MSNRFKVVHEETMCCGNKRCPVIKIFEDGSVEISDNDGELGSVGTIKLRPEQVALLADRLNVIRK